VTVIASGTTALSLRSGTKGACRHVGTPTLVSNRTEKESVESVVYFEGEASSPLYRRALGITASGLRSV